MSFNGTEGSPITLAQGSTLTAAFRKANPGSTLGVFIGKEHIIDLISQTGSEGIRVYFGRDSSGSNTVVMVGADSNEDDILDLIIDCGKPSPPNGGDANDLNS